MTFVIVNRHLFITTLSETRGVIFILSGSLGRACLKIKVCVVCSGIIFLRLAILRYIMHTDYMENYEH